MKPKLIVRITVIAVSAVYSLLLFNLGFTLDTFSKQVVAVLPLTAAVALLAWDLWAWKLPLIHKMTKRPLIKGLWRVELKPHRGSVIPNGGNRGPIKAYITVNQSFWNLDITLFTKESSSESRAVFWDSDAKKSVSKLCFTYVNTPNMSESHRSIVSAGTCNLAVRKLKPKTIKGSYFTDRYTKGDMNLTYLDASAEHDTFESIENYTLAK
jgi:hypothetical protein